MSKEKIERLNFLLKSSTNLNTSYLVKLEAALSFEILKDSPNLNKILEFHKTHGKEEIQKTVFNFEFLVEKLNELCFLSELTLSEIDLDNDYINDLEKVVTNLVKISSLSQTLINGSELSAYLYKDTYLQILNVSEFIEEVAGQLNQEGISSGNNDLKYIVRRLEDIKNYPVQEIGKISNTKDLYLDLLENIGKVLD